MLADRDYFDNLLNTLPDTYRVMLRQGLYGNYFTFYLCDLLLKVNGKGGQPVYIKLVEQSSGRCTPPMKTFSERNVIVIGAIGVLLTAAIVAGALNYNKLPFVSSGKSYSAYFDEAGGLTTGAPPVRVSGGAPAGQVQSITLDGSGYWSRSR